ncbi:MAG: BrnA antitoxin family protein [Hyphomicrobiales bacterium]|nr:BrnA antitoxin family protein [Hyphomicrobiales bacterium]
MTGNEPSTATGSIDPDDAPDLSSPEYQANLAAAPVRRGRPKSASPKVRVGLRLSAELVERIRASGPGYNALSRKRFVSGPRSGGP